MKIQHARRGSNSLVIVAVALIVVALTFVGGILWVLLAPPAEPADTAPTGDGTTTTTTTTTTSATTTTTTTATVTTTTTATGTTQSQDPADGELLQYETTGHYVQNGVSDWRLLLVNDWNPITADYEQDITLVSVGSQKVDSRIIDDLNTMLTAGKAYGIGVQSGYRAYAHQSSLYWRKVDEYKNLGYDNVAAQTAAGKVVKRPGYSEHNCGLAVDLGGSGNFKLEADFADTPAYAWLIENCADYGFILRFPEGKENITGVIYEAWHFRYVGKDAATYMMENDLCLEEYLEQNEQ